MTRRKGDTVIPDTLPEPEPKPFGRKNRGKPDIFVPSKRVLSSLDESYEDDIYVPPDNDYEPPAFTAANQQMLRSLLREISARRKEALRLYKPYPNQEDFHASKARKKLAVGGNRGGKTVVAAAEVARAITGTDPYHKYPSRAMRLIFVGKDLIHCSKVMFRKLFKSGAFPILRDLETGEWRAFNPATDNEREDECRDALPFVPARFIKSISWENAREETARTVRLNSGTECTFFSGEGEPPQGWDADLVWMDEEIPHPKWFSEMVPRLVDRGGTLIWSATPQIGSPAFYDLMNQAELLEEDPDAAVQKFFFNIDTNIFISEERRQQFKADMAHDEEEYRVRVEGKSALEGQRVYGEFQPRGIHKCAACPVPSDWARYVFIDPGRQVAAALFVAVPEPHSEYARHEAIVYDEIYCRKANAEIFAKTMQQHVADQWIQSWFIDSHGSRVHEIGSGVDVETRYRDAFLEAGLGNNGFRTFWWASDDVEGGILAVKSKLHVQSGVPKWLFMTENLRWLTWEMERYSNKKLGRTNLVIDRPDTRNNHLCDCLRYGAMSNPQYVRPPNLKRGTPKSWSDKYLKAKKQRAAKESPGGGAICVF